MYIYFLSIVLCFIDEPFGPLWCLCCKPLLSEPFSVLRNKQSNHCRGLGLCSAFCCKQNLELASWLQTVFSSCARKTLYVDHITESTILQNWNIRVFTHINTQKKNNVLDEGRCGSDGPLPSKHRPELDPDVVSQENKLSPPLWYSNSPLPRLHSLTLEVAELDTGKDLAHECLSG